eukprot:jgi/Tetstr1/420998/TSEL_012058.t1
MAVPAPPMSRATSSQHPATTASATADGAVAGGDALLGDDDAPGAPRQEAEEAVVEATDRAEGWRKAATCTIMCVDCGQRTDWECCCDGTPALCGPKYPCMATHQRAVPCPTTATVRAEFRHVRDKFHDATRAAVCEASEKARAAGGVRRERRRTAHEMKESETCRQ